MFRPPTKYSEYLQDVRKSIDYILSRVNAIAGSLRLSGGVGMSATPVVVTDQLNTPSILKLSTNLVQIDGTLNFPKNYLNGAVNEPNIFITTQNQPDPNNFPNKNFFTLSVGLTYVQNGVEPLDTGYGNTYLGLGNSAIAGNNSYFNAIIGYASSITVAEPGNLVMGYSSFSATANAVVIGREASVSGFNGSALGYLATTSTPNGFAIGNSSSLLQIGGNFVPTARVHIKGLGSTSATTSLLVQNSGGVSSLQVNDDGSVFNYGKGSVTTNTAFGLAALASNTTGSGNTAIGRDSLRLNSTGTGNTALGYLAMEKNTNSNNTALGYRSLQANTSGSLNVGVGVDALFSNTTGVNNTAIGYQAANTNVTGQDITAVGYWALRLNTGSENTALGSGSLRTNTTGGENTSVGFNSLATNSTGSNNTAVGRAALSTNSTGSDNTAVGRAALLSTTSSENTAIGSSALATNTTGGSNTAIGYLALQSNSTGFSNTAVGNSALRFNTASGNTAVGLNAGYSNTSGSVTAVGAEAAYSNTSGIEVTAVGYQALRLSTGGSNTAVGFQAGDNITTGAGNVCIGSGAKPLNATDSNQFVVGSATVNAGAITTEVVVSDTTWSVRINGTAYKILLKA